MAKIRRLGQFALALVTLLLLVYMVCIGIRNVFRYNKFKLDYESAAKQLDLERQKHSYLEQQLNGMAHPSYWEFKAKQMGYVRRGEFVYKLKPRKGVSK